MCGGTGTLQAYPLPISELPASVFVKDRNSVGDGGGGLFYWDAGSIESENCATIVKPVGTPPDRPGRWKRSVNFFTASNVGIGTMVPDGKLVVQGPGTWGTIRVWPEENGKESSIGFKQNTDGSGAAWIVGQNTWGVGSGNFAIGNDIGLKLAITRESGNVGIGMSNPQKNLSVNSALNIDQADLNPGSVNPGLTFGSNSEEGIASKRTSGGNRLGLDFYTRSIRILSIKRGN